MSKVENTNIYFASDFHLGVDLQLTSKERELVIVQWLNSIIGDAKAVYLVGDVFDFWFEYKKVIPKGNVRLLGTLARMIDLGIEVHFLKGNHDMWIYDYFQREIGMQVYDHGVYKILDGQKFYIAHGDGLGKGDNSYKWIKRLLRNPFAQKLFSLIHPTIGLKMMRLSSKKSREKNQPPPEIHQARIIEYAEKLSTQGGLDYFVCGHYHHPQIKTLSNNQTKYCNLGDWITHFSYAIWNGQNLELKNFKNH